MIVEEDCNLIKAKTRNPKYNNHTKWLGQVDQAVGYVSSYDTKMKGFAHRNKYKELPIKVILKILHSLKYYPEYNNAVSFDEVKELLAHVHIAVKKQADLKKKPDLCHAWWMRPDINSRDSTNVDKNNDEQVPSVALIPMDMPVDMPTLSTILPH